MASNQPAAAPGAPGLFVPSALRAAGFGGFLIRFGGLRFRVLGLGFRVQG